MGVRGMNPLFIPLVLGLLGTIIGLGISIGLDPLPAIFLGVTVTGLALGVRLLRKGSV
jgi:hypothetical protein